MLRQIKTKYVDEMGYIEATRRYGDDSRAIQAFSEFGENLFTATVCLIDYHEKPAEGNVFIKTWSENEGVYECLLQLGIIGTKIREVPAGYAVAYECPLLLEV
jgi:hypothetical protein